MLTPDLYIITRPPKAILVSSPAMHDVHLQGLPDGLLPLFPSKTYASKENQLFVRSRPFDRQGFTLTPTFAITEFKAQEQTLPTAFLSLTARQKNRNGADFMATYMQLSRVVSLEGIHLLSTIDKEHWMSLRLPFRMKEGIERLKMLDTMTMEMYLRDFGLT
ncbi:hypothetical protein F4804DRAFT_27590 [Jackrogersella minutella]|nr:hypothetical protein F4804DRAFT_27590 [Jackrogersella minutella]